MPWRSFSLGRPSESRGRKNYTVGRVNVRCVTPLGELTDSTSKRSSSSSQPVPETFPAPKQYRHDDDVQVVDEVRGEELPDGRGSSADADVEASGGLSGRLERRVGGGVDEVENAAPGHVDQGDG